MEEKIRVTVWNEGRHEKTRDDVRAVYPRGIHTVIAEGLSEEGFTIKTVTLDDPDQGLSEAILNDTDVLIWWAHGAHKEVQDEYVDKVYQRVLKGMGLLVLHSGHKSKIFLKLMGTSCDIKWREADEKERIWIIEPGHPIAVGLPEYFELDQEEMYGERFDIPSPDELVMISWFKGGEVFRSGCCYRRGRGKIFYFRPGHEIYRTYYQPTIRKVIANAVRWAKPTAGPIPTFGNVKPLEQLD